MTTDHKNTLNLPSTSFEMRANLAQKEPKFLEQWAARGLYDEIVAARRGKKTFVLHDGPPYANGALHHGHILNKVLKDLIVKDRTMAGLSVSYVPGWDCHGLPIEQQVDKALGSKKATMQPHEVAQACRDYANKFVDSQRASFKRLGVMGDWDHPYRTMDAPYEAQTMREFARLTEAGLIYKSLRPVHWCTVHKTALAEAEVEYAEKSSPSLYVAFRAHPDARLQAVAAPVDLVIWTTTPWTLPANVAVVVHPELTYVVYRLGERHVLVAEATLEHFLKAVGEPADEGARAQGIVARYEGAALTGLTYDHPFLPRQGRVVADTFVEVETGTGCVHTAPAHGVDDFRVGQEAGLEVVSGVDDRGVLCAVAGPFAGATLKDANPKIIAHLAQSGALLSDPTKSIQHRYAHCWRCHQPIITRATEQWFMAMDKPFAQGPTLRQRAMACLQDVQFIPQWGVDRIGGMLEGRPDWCLSRQRTWGVPIPVVYCRGCNTPKLSPELMRKVAERVETEGASAWLSHDLKTLVGALRCDACGGEDFRKETDILDVWFDSGVSYAAVLEARELGHRQGPPADLYLEGSDQHRGWFHSSLLTSLATRQRPPYRAVLTHGFVVDGEGRKISKSLGNFTDPFKAIEREGAELWRLWAASEDYQQDVRVSAQIFKQLSDTYRKIRNTLRYLLGNLSGFDPQKDAVTWEALEPIDRYAVARADEAQQAIRAAFEQYTFHVGQQRLLQWCNLELSSFYFDILKDRLYASLPTSRARRAAQTALAFILHDMVRVMAPIFAFTAEEVWQAMPKTRHDAPSVHLALYPELDDSSSIQSLRAHARDEAPALHALFAQVATVRRTALSALEEARQQKRIGSSVQAQLVLTAGGQVHKELAAISEAAWADYLIVSQVTLRVTEDDDTPLRVVVEPAEGDKCPRCWLYRELKPAQDPAGSALCARCTEANR